MHRSSCWSGSPSPTATSSRDTATRSTWTAIDEAVILSTCNRVEIYANVPSYHAGFLALKRILTETRGVAPDELAEPLYSHWEQDAADHLFAVAAGLDSMVLGETQIHAQVREALRTRRGRRAPRVPRSRSLFHAAARAGRRARAETSLGAAPDAFVSLGADLATEGSAICEAATSSWSAPAGWRASP